MNTTFIAFKPSEQRRTIGRVDDVPAQASVPIGIYLVLGGFVGVYASLVGYLWWQDLGKDLLQYAALATMLAGGVLLVRYLRERDYVKLGAFSCMFVMCMAITYRNMSNSAGSVLMYQAFAYLVFVGGYVVTIAAERTGSRLKEALAAAMLFPVLVSSVGYLVFLNQLSSSLIGRRFETDALHPIGVAYGFGVLCVFSAVFAIVEQRRCLKVLAISCVVASLLSILMTGSRGALVAALATIYWIGVCSGGVKRFLWGTIGLGGLLALALFAFYLMDQNFSHSRVDLLYERLVGLKTGEDSALLGRIALIRLYYSDMSAMLPFGLQGYKYEEYPHNSIAEAVVRFGLFGVILAVVMVVGFIKAVLLSRDAMKRGNLVVCVCASVLVFSFIQGVTSLPLERHRALWLGIGSLSALSLSLIDAFFLRDLRHGRKENI